VPQRRKAAVERGKEADSENNRTTGLYGALKRRGFQLPPASSSFSLSLVPCLLGQKTTDRAPAGT
jgi:hypothetical protein